MAEERNREKLSEMEQIHRGLEAFLEKEVYEERENGHQNGNRVYEAGQEERAGEIYPGEEQEFAFDRNANEEAYGGYVEEYNDSVYDNEEPVRMAMAKQNGNVVRTRQRENPEQASRAGRSGRGKSGGSGGKRERKVCRFRGKRERKVQRFRGKRERKVHWLRGEQKRKVCRFWGKRSGKRLPGFGRWRKFHVPGRGQTAAPGGKTKEKAQGTPALSHGGNRASAGSDRIVVFDHIPPV